MTCRNLLLIDLKEVGILAALWVRHSHFGILAVWPYRLPSIRHSGIRYFGQAFGIPVFGIPGCAQFCGA